MGSFPIFNGKLGTTRVALHCRSWLCLIIRWFECDYLINGNLHLPTISLSFHRLKDLHWLKICKSRYPQNIFLAWLWFLIKYRNRTLAYTLKTCFNPIAFQTWILSVSENGSLRWEHAFLLPSLLPDVSVVLVHQGVCLPWASFSLLTSPHYYLQFLSIFFWENV